jgi:hypothetical protein
MVFMLSHSESDFSILRLQKRFLMFKLISHRFCYSTRILPIADASASRTNWSLIPVKSRAIMFDILTVALLNIYSN